jgi:hypothetical protein
MSTEPKPMDPGRLDDLRRTVDPVRFPSFDELLAAHDYWRARCPVGAGEIERAGLTWAHAQAHAAKYGAPTSHDMTTPGWAEYDARERGGRHMVALIQAHIQLVAMLSKYSRDRATWKCEHDVFEEESAPS